MPQLVSTQELRWQASKTCWCIDLCLLRLVKAHKPIDKENKDDLTGNCKGQTGKKTLLGQVAVAEQELARQPPPAARPETAAKASTSVSTPRAVVLQPDLQGLGLLWQPEKKPLQLPIWLLPDLTE